MPGARFHNHAAADTGLKGTLEENGRDGGKRELAYLLQCFLELFLVVYCVICDPSLRRIGVRKEIAEGERRVATCDAYLEDGVLELAELCLLDGFEDDSSGRGG